MALSLIINTEGYVCLADKVLDVRWCNCLLGYPPEENNGLKAVYDKFITDRKGFDPEFHMYSDLAYQPILKWSEE